MDIKQQIKQAHSWEERYRLLVQAGKELKQPSPEILSQMPQIQGCEAKLWFSAQQLADHHYAFSAYSQARIINGLLYLLLTEINGKNAEQLKSFDIQDYFNQLGIAQHLSSSRLNGLQEIGKILNQLAS